MASIPLGGDQLTRVTFDSVRVLRSGTHSQTERSRGRIIISCSARLVRENHQNHLHTRNSS
ncbi:hypothetical protein DPMN_029298 [Dreissena polymorpha]|uniref:Uncharacterized protein n=1 Tax=Dreissena polymorpha TaxID=45954 RepID=A0A9D4LYG4_DREPO|nr:hypothetical protein DPMN_029298 [Dreissena polymorpha]